MSKAETVNSMLATVNPIIFGEQSRIELRYVRFEDVQEQDINANVMPTNMFNQLVANVKGNKALESVPLCATRVETPDKIEIVSGHHRIRAGKQAGLDGCVVLLYNGLTNSEIRAKQLAHNSIAGTSDPEIVKQIFEQIDEVASRMEAYIDPSLFEELPTAIEFEPIGIDPLADAKTVTVVFLPTQLRDFSTAVEFLTDQPDLVYLADRESFDGFKKAVNDVKAELEIMSYPTAFATMARLAMERLAQLKMEHAQGSAMAEIRGTEAPALIDSVPVKLDDDTLRALSGD